MKTLLKNLSVSKHTLFFILLLLVLPFISCSRVPDPSLTPRMLALNILVLAYVIILLLQDRNSITRDRRGIRLPWMVVAYGGYLFFAGISIFFAINKWESIYDWTKGVLVFSCFLLMIHALNGGASREILVKIVVLLALLLSIRGFYEVFSVSSGGAFDHQASYFIRAYSSNRNLFSQFLFLCLPFTAWGISGLHRGWRILSIIDTLSILVLSVILLTRSVWIAILFASALTFILFTVYGSRSTGLTRPVKRFFLFLFLFLAVLGISLVIYSQFGDLKVFREQLYWIGNYKFGSSLERVELWQKTLRMSRDHLLTGVGAGNWKVVFPSYGMMTTRPDAATTFFQRPHNDFLWVLAENGVVAFVFYLSVFFLAFRNAILNLKASQEARDLYFKLAIVFGLTGYLVFAFFSFPRERIEHQVVFHLYLALVITARPRKKLEINFGKTPETALYTLVVFLLLFHATTTIYRLSSEKYTLRAYQYRDQQNHQQTMNAIDHAENFCTTLDTYSTPIVWYRGEAHFVLGQKDAAFRDFIKAYSYHPNHIYVLNDLATAYELNGDHARARNLYLKAVSIFPEFEDALLNLAALYYNAGETDSALLMLSKIPLTADDARYLTFRKAILQKKLQTMIDSSDERIIRKSVERIKNSEEWTLKVFEKAIGLNASFVDEIYREVIYLLESVDSTLTPGQALDFRLKYNLETHE